MSRYIYKPLVTYFPGETPEETEANKYDFIQAYKKSLTSGELLVDLYNYDVYVANNGLEYPVPSTPELKKEIINWIESDEGPLASYSKYDLLNDSGKDPTESSIARKKAKADLMFKEVEKYNTACNEKIKNDENTLLRIEREVDIWYNNLADFTKKKVFSSNSDGTESVKVIYMIITKYYELYKRLRNILNYLITLKANETKINDELAAYTDSLKEIFVTLVNNQKAIESKLDKDEINIFDGKDTPDLTFDFRFNAPTQSIDNPLHTKLTEIKRVSEDSIQDETYETTATLESQTVINIHTGKKVT